MYYFAIFILYSLVVFKYEIRTFELLKFDNGEMILVEFSTMPKNGEYKIQGIKIIPNEMKDFIR